MSDELKIYRGTFLGSLLEQKGKTKENKDWVKYKVTFAHAKKDGEDARITFSTFYDASKLSVGDNYEVKFKEEEYKNKAGIDVKGKKAVFFTKIGNNSVLGFEYKAPVHEVVKSNSGVAISEEQNIPPISDIEFVESYRNEVKAELWSVQHFAGTYLGIVANEKEYQRLKNLYNEKLLRK